MSPLTLELKQQPALRIDMAPFTPDRLAGKDTQAIAQIPLWQGNKKYLAGELFSISGADSEHLIIRADSPRLDNIGQRMSHGHILLTGTTGDYLGRQMRGGSIQVNGDTGCFAGCGMTQGNITIDGNAGDFFGGAISGELQGMRGGTLWLKGNAGDRVGDHQRRGMILIEGNAGDYCASRMVAGTIAVLGQVGDQAGLAMRRGTLLLTQKPRSIPATFNNNGRHNLNFLSLLTSSWQVMDGPFSQLNSRGVRVEHWLGDLSCDGKGEILVWC